MRPFDDDHLKFIAALNKFHVRYVIIGGHAAIYHGVNRNTGDLDILIEASVDNGHRLLDALKSIDLQVPEINDSEWVSNLVLSFGFEPDAVDILNYSPGINFKDVLQNSVHISQNEIDIPIIDIRDLIKNKEALKRTGEKAHLDKYDVEILKKIISKKTNE